jgi:hexokinase
MASRIASRDGPKTTARIAIPKSGADRRRADVALEHPAREGRLFPDGCAPSTAHIATRKRNLVATRTGAPKVEGADRIARSLRLSRAQLEDVRRAMFERIARGLTEDEISVGGVLAFLPPPPEGLSGKAIVVDCGGTNIRGALVELDGEGRAHVIARSKEARVRDVERRIREDGDESGNHFFDAQAELVAGVAAHANEPLPLGYCFSFPAAVEGNGDARAIALTKDIEIPGVVGTLVGGRLARALEARGVRVESAMVENDTVACLIGGASTVAHEDRSRFIGLIAGTGTNIAGFFSADQSPKIARAGWTGKMAVNLETAQLEPRHLTRFDDEIDRASQHPGSARYEKALSGRYLPYLLKAIVPDAPFHPEEGTAAVVRIRDDPQQDQGTRQIARALLDRSADLVAAGLAAVFEHYGPGPEIKVLAEGSLMWKTPGYAGRVAHTLAKLLRSRDGVTRDFSILRLEDPNLAGAAAGALMARRAEDP